MSQKSYNFSPKVYKIYPIISHKLIKIHSFSYGEPNNMSPENRNRLSNAFINTFFALCIIQLFALALYGFNSMWIFFIALIFGILAVWLDNGGGK